MPSKRRIRNNKKMEQEYYRMPRPRLTRSVTRLERAAINLHRFLHANLGGTEDWPIRFRGTEEHTPELCHLLNELQNEMERAGQRPGRFRFVAAHRKRQPTKPE
jgi:hypothetical protein